MLTKIPPQQYRQISRPVRRRPRRGLFLACLPLSGLLLGLFVCSLIGVGIGLVWLTVPPESNEVARIRRLPPLRLPPLTPTLRPTTVTNLNTSELDPVEPTSLPRIATSNPTPSAPTTPTPALADNPALAVTAAPVASGVTPPPVSANPSTPTPPPASTSASTSVPTPTATPTLLPAFTPTPLPTANVDESVEPTATPAAVPIPESWQDYMNRNPKSED